MRRALRRCPASHVKGKHMNIDLQGRTAIVTSSSAGIGRATAEALARAGASVIINGRSQSRVDEEHLVADMIELTRQYGCYGCQGIAALLKEAGWHVNDKCVERLWRREGLEVPLKQSKRGRLWLNDGSCVRLRPEYPDHVWSCDFVNCRTIEGKLSGRLTS